MWYTTSKKDDRQGLVGDEDTGETIAITYKPENAPLVAAAPELLRVCEEFIAAYDEDGFESIFHRQDAVRKMRDAIRNARGES